MDRKLNTTKFIYNKRRNTVLFDFTTLQEEGLSCILNNAVIYASLIINRDKSNKDKAVLLNYSVLPIQKRQSFMVLVCMSEKMKSRKELKKILNMECEKPFSGEITCPVYDFDEPDKMEGLIMQSIMGTTCVKGIYSVLTYVNEEMNAEFWFYNDTSDTIPLQDFLSHEKKITYCFYKLESIGDVCVIKEAISPDFRIDLIKDRAGCYYMRFDGDYEKYLMPVYEMLEKSEKPFHFEIISEDIFRKWNYS